MTRRDLAGRHVLLTTDAVGGVWSYSLAVAAGLAAQGARCTLATLGPAPSAAQRAQAAGLRLVETGWPLDWTAPDAATLAQVAAALGGLAAQCGAGTLHLHAPALAAFPFRLPVAAVAHSCVGTWWRAVRAGPAPAAFAWRMALMAEGLARADAVVAPSHAFAAALRSAYGLRRTITVIHNGLPAAAPANVSRERSVLAAGRLWDAGKNLAVLDQAAASLDAPVHAAGPAAGPDGSAFAPRCLRLLGNLAAAELRAAYGRAAVFAAPALYEPFGLAVLEAAQSATPLVLSDIPTFRELWDGAAVFVPPRDAAAWRDALQALLAAPDRRARLGAQAQARAARYGAEPMVAATAALHAAMPALEPA